MIHSHATLSTICNLSTDVRFPGFQPSTTSLLVEPPCFRRLPVVHGRTAGSLPLVAPSFKTKVVMNAIGSDIFGCQTRSHHDILFKSGCIFIIYIYTLSLSLSLSLSVRHWQVSVRPLGVPGLTRIIAHIYIYIVYDSI